MRAISLWQPWASLWAMGEKVNETRGWSTKVRGKVLIHAAKRFQRDERCICRQWPFNDSLRERYSLLSDIPLGALIGWINIVASDPTERMRYLVSSRELSFGNYSDGRFAWRTRGGGLFETPIPYKGKQGFFMVPDEIVSEEMSSAKEKQRGSTESK